MDKHAVGRVFEEIAAFLELKGDNPFRVRAYENAARVIAAYPGDLAELRGVGKGSLEIVRELVDTGRSSTLEALRREIPPGLVEMMQIPGLGVAKIRQIHEHLHIDTLADLEQAAADGRLATI